MALLVSFGSIHFFLGAMTIRGMYAGIIGDAKKIGASAPVEMMIANLEIESIRSMHIYVLTGILLLLVSVLIWFSSKGVARLLCVGLGDRAADEK